MIIKINMSGFEIRMLQDAKEDRKAGNMIDEGTLSMLGDILLDNYVG